MKTKILGNEYYVRDKSIAWYFIKGKSKLGDALRYLWESRSVIALILFVTCITLGFAILSTLNANANATEISPPTETEMVFYDIPLSEDLQRHIIEVCNANDVDEKLVFALIERESNYNIDAIGDEGTSFGLMQVREMFHKDRMEKLGVEDLLDPYQNVIVGIDILKEKLNMYDTTYEALTAYNAGDTGAYELYFSKGIEGNDYAYEVVHIMEMMSNRKV